MLSRICTCLLMLLVAVLTARAQDQTCDLELKVFSYDALNSPKRRLTNVGVRLEGKGIKENTVLSEESGTGFKAVKEGHYQLEFQVAGYKRRTKPVELDCGLMDEEGSVTIYAYLWRDRKAIPPDPNLGIDEKNKAVSTDPTPKPVSSDEKLYGTVNIQILIDEDGNVVSASRIDGNRKLAGIAIRKARQAKFTPTLVNGTPVQVSGSIRYNFVP